VRRVPGAVQVSSAAFRRCVAAVFEKLGLPQPEPAYVRDLEALDEACAAWHRERNLGPLLFTLPELGPALVTGNLDQADDAGFLGNEAARDFVRFVDCRTGYRCTLLMLQVCLTIQLAVQENKVNAAGGAA